jgi:hypothetical protein
MDGINPEMHGEFKPQAHSMILHPEKELVNAIDS